MAKSELNAGDFEILRSKNVPKALEALDRIVKRNDPDEMEMLFLCAKDFDIMPAVTNRIYEALKNIPAATQTWNVGEDEKAIVYKKGKINEAIPKKGGLFYAFFSFIFSVLFKSLPFFVIILLIITTIGIGGNYVFPGLFPLMRGLSAHWFLEYEKAIVFLTDAHQSISDCPDKFDPDHFSFIPEMVGDNYSLLGNKKNALIWWEKAASVRKKSANLWLDIARAYGKLEEYEKAFSAYDKCIQMDIDGYVVDKAKTEKKTLEIQLRLKSGAYF